ncbi:Retrovirus-related Pol polyprotein from transposon 17.6 [Araneus ventricosus]|uniref:RNA-directed DNA polymerase n=1 Tax=Araneus ventricosus TaxID=182803 RepID=A0A4Y2AUT1_ARAVE|nr:Retrovirus-related Pol polyprotein from transposon 17.6 [Araneus ventricosus]GBL82866.1 Retrovirus-related Pol polyprotein from transposon 17.6 [Araneus ventricosus]
MSNSLVASLTPFKGKEDSSEFFTKQLNDIAHLEKWGEAKKILVLKLNLKDEALKFLVSNPKLEEINDFDFLVSKLKEKFCKQPNFEDAQRQFHNLKQKVSQSFSDLADQVSLSTEKFVNPKGSEEENLVTLTEKLKLSKFIQALMSDIRVEVKKLGPNYDFLQRNNVVIDTVNKQLLVGNEKFDFEKNSPTNVYSETTDCDISESDKEKKERCEQINNNIGEKVNASEETFHAHNVKINNSITVQTFSAEIINLKVPKNTSKGKDLIFFPKNNKLGYVINESLNVPTNANLFHTISENKTNKVIHLRKNTILGKLSTFDVNDIMSPSESEIDQINNLNLNEIHKMLRDELLKSDFKLDHLNDEDKKDMQELLLKNLKVFSKSYKTLGETSAVTPEFSLLHNFPLQTKPYSIPLIAKKYAQQEINNLLEAGIIEPSSSSYCFPVIFIKKKQNPNDSNSEPKFRMVVDYRLLNSITETFKICVPKICEIIKSIAGRKIYCVLDLKSAFFQIKLRDEDKRKLAFCTEIGNFQPTRLPFGSKNSTSYFHTLISKCLNSITGKNVQFFLDDIIIAADSLSELKVTLQQVFHRLIKFNLTLDPAKLQLCKSEITYLGFDLNSNGFSPSEQNINKVTNFPRPKNLKQVQMFLGMLNYFGGLIYDYAGIVEPLVKLTKKNTPFVWSVECENAFNAVQEIILKKLTLKNFDPNLPISLITDASKIAICGILLQKKTMCISL